MAINARFIGLTITLACLVIVLSPSGWLWGQPQITSRMLPNAPRAIAALPISSQTVAQAQEISSAVQNTSGQRILINGRAIAASWEVSAGQLLIEESGLVQGLGAELLSSSDYNSQPIRWFSGAQWLNTPDETLHPLSTVLAAQYRLLNITSLADQAQWQWHEQGGTLEISTPSTQVTGIRQSTQSWGDRIVIDLDQATPWQIVKNNSELAIAIDASMPNDLSPIHLQSGSRVTSIQVEESGQQTLVRVVKPANLYAQTRTLAAPNRIVIDFQHTPTVEFSIHWAPGLWWQQKLVRSSGSIVPVTILEIDRDEPTLDIRPIWSQQTTVERTQPLLTIAQQWQAIAAINGGFFNRDNQLPLGAIRHNGNWISGPILNRGAIAWTPRGDLQIGRLSLQETLKTESGTTLTLKHLNSGYVQAGVSRYTPLWGSSYSPLTDYETIVTIQDNQVTQQQRIERAGQTRVPIPSNGYILSVRANDSVLESLSIGTQVNVDTLVVPDTFSAHSEVLGAGPLLIQNHRSVLNPQAEEFADSFSQQKASRSAIGITDQNHLLFAIAQQQIDGSGISLGQMGEIMQQLGATNALNLDGGSSTTLVLGQRVLNSSPDFVARVNNGIGIFFNPDS